MILLNHVTTNELNKQTENEQIIKLKIKLESNILQIQGAWY